MKRFSILLAAVTVLAGGCGSSSTSPAPEEFRFTATLKPSEETPPITNAEQSGSGTATIVFNVTKDSSGAVSAGTVNFVVTLTGFPSSIVVTQAHIHAGALGVKGDILVSTTIGSNEVALTNGAGTFSRVAVAITAPQAQAIIDKPGDFYFNVHTFANPGGVARGQLVKQ